MNKVVALTDKEGSGYSRFTSVLYWAYGTGNSNVIKRLIDNIGSSDRLKAGNVDMRMFCGGCFIVIPKF